MYNESFSACHLIRDRGSLCRYSPLVCCWHVVCGTVCGEVYRRCSVQFRPCGYLGSQQVISPVIQRMEMADLCEAVAEYAKPLIAVCLFFSPRNTFHPDAIPLIDPVIDWFFLLGVDTPATTKLLTPSQSKLEPHHGFNPKAMCSSQRCSSLLTCPQKTQSHQPLLFICSFYVWLLAPNLRRCPAISLDSFGESH